MPTEVKGRTVLVCGGRDYASPAFLWRFLDAAHARNPIGVLIHGACRTGADKMADDWALERGIPVRRYPADWATYGRSAGPMRNQRMLDEARPDEVIAFSGGRGTADMVRRAREAGVPVTLASEALR